MAQQISSTERKKKNNLKSRILYATKISFRNRHEGNPRKATAENLFDSNRHPGNESEALVFTYSGGAMEVIIFNK